VPGRPHPFRFGVVAATAQSGLDWATKARRIEALGFNTLLVPDTLRYTLAPFPALAAAATATTSLRLGTYVLANDSRNPVVVAKDTATLDRLSDGRLELGIGAGRPGAEADNRMLGVSFDSGARRLARLAESVGIIKSLLGGQRTTRNGQFYSPSDAEISPPPVQSHVPLLVAASGPRLLALAAREADVVALGLPPDTSEAAAAEKVDVLRQAAGERFDDIELNMSLMAVGERIPAYVTAQLGLTIAELAERNAVAAVTGSPDEMAATLLRRRASLGISYVVVSEELMDPFAPVLERLAGQ
jgi:probable F420-dependent oxidoreductase